MVHLRLVAGTDVTGISRKRPRARQVSEAAPVLAQVRRGTFLAAQVDAYEHPAVRPRRRKDPLKLLKVKARAALRSLALPGEKRALAEMLDEMTQHVRARKLAGENPWDVAFTEFHQRLRAYGIYVSMPQLWRTPNEELECEVLNEDLLLRQYPQCRPYESVLRHLSFRAPGRWC